MMIEKDKLLSDPVVDLLIARALEEDVGAGDVTSIALIEEDAKAGGVIVSRGEYVLSGGPIAARVFKAVDPAVEVSLLHAEGDNVEKGEAVLAVAGPVRNILTAERTALNFMQRMTGIATLTNTFVSKVAPHDVMILDTRKTTPGMRAIEKYAVSCGGGANHRYGLYDRVLIKDNHRKMWSGSGTRGLAEAVETARDKYPELLVEIEVESPEELRDALKANPDWVLLDNMGPEKLRDCVAINNGQAKLEASGGIMLENVEAIAATGINAISLGCLTHSAPAADLSLELED